ncbi:PREDICTED: NDR1/HIN1-like protein 12 [Ipomoea nil]|uniref:NDR1/HIN1-like protein 12 n=1 Tax=Ipomoea nil TaxID=35883 RepID=UPI000900CCE2|nr:PREDICTED: NDR1/HIN1-like protein 12 [Ipomoea nil]
MSAKDCAHHHRERRKLYHRLFLALLCSIILILFIVFLIWLILRPTKPRFILQDATVYNFNVTGAAATGLNLLTTTIQVTLASRNPNERIGIYYDRLDVYATYRGQQITLPTLLPASYQGHKDVTIWSPFLNGNTVPVAPYLGLEISQDQNAGRVLINIRVDGRIRWKVGTFISGRYRLDANCPAYLSFGENYSPNSILVGSTAKYQLVQNCHVDV